MKAHQIPCHCKIIKRDALYLKRVDALIKQLKVALFFAHTCRGDVEEDFVVSDSATSESNSEEEIGSNVVDIVRGAYECHKQMLQCSRGEEAGKGIENRLRCIKGAYRKLRRVHETRTSEH